MKKRILVIRLGALGDLVLCFEAFHRLRAANPDAEIALLTMPAFAGFASKMPWFDRIILDERAPFVNVFKWWKLMKRVRDFAPTDVVDFQCKDRQSLMFWLMGGALWKGRWSGSARYCSHPRPWPPADKQHCGLQLLLHLESFGIGEQTPIDLSWFDAPIKQFNLPEKFVLFIPGCAIQHGHKRWPPESYAALGRFLQDQGFAVVAIGAKDDQAVIHGIAKDLPNLVDLSCKTSLLDVAGIARAASLVVGNDTGPTHMAASTGVKTLALMSDRVNPYWSSPRGVGAAWLQGSPLSSLTVGEVQAFIQDKFL